MSRAGSLVCIVMLISTINAFAYAVDPGFSTGSCELGDAVVPGSGTVLEVAKTGAPHSTIQSAVDSASEGDTILIHPGTYFETVNVTTPGLRIRGTDRNTVVLDGGSALENGFDVTADRVVIENMTAHNYTGTAFFWDHVTGYWGRYLTGYNTEGYGLYAYASRCGQFDHSYGSGSADSAFYIGECFPCDAVIHDVVAEENGLGYSGTNAGGNLTIRDSEWRGNGLGIVPNSLDGEARPPQRGVIIAHNLLDENNGIDVPGSGLTGMYWGGGIVIAGGQSNVVYGNTVTGHGKAGIILSPLPDQNVWISSANVIWGNQVTHDAAQWPDSIDLAQAALSGPGNCWTDNVFATSAPPEIETIWNCGITLTPPGGDPRVEVALLEGPFGLNGRTPGDWKTWPAPPPQPNMPADDGAIDSWLPALF